VAGHLAAGAEPGDIIMTLGAGDISLLIPEILELLADRLDEVGP
jgi:UDP-N-acetylmuramate--alanine ligase